MSSSRIRAALERLRGASLRLRRRPARETTSALASVLETWRDPDSEVRGSLRAEYADATGFSPAMVEAGMAEMDVIVLVSNCPQLNNPCNAYDPSPIQMVIWDD